LLRARRVVSVSFIYTNEPMLLTEAGMLNRCALWLGYLASSAIILD
jgi:hypothetical protein